MPGFGFLRKFANNDKRVLNGFINKAYLTKENVEAFNKLTFRDLYPYPHLDDKNTTYKKFIILGIERTGSSLLVDLLRSHPGVICYGELFQNERVLFNYLGYPTPEDHNFIQYRNDQTIGFMKNFVFKPYKNYIEAVGFKIFYHHARNNKSSVVWSYLQSLQGLKVIHIQRENLFHSLVSAKMALLKEAVKYPEWAAKEIRRMNMGSFSVDKMYGAQQWIIEIDPDECRKYFENTSKEIKMHQDYFSDNPVLDIFYEEILFNLESVNNKMLNFLDLKDFPLKHLSERQIIQPMHEIVKNYDELKNAFSGTKWETFFNE